MNRLTCASCDQSIPNGQAVIRSIAFEQVAFHKPGSCPTAAPKVLEVRWMATAS